MTVLPDLLAALAGGSVEVVDLTAPLSESTPVLQLPPPFANTRPFSLTEVSRYDDRGPAWYWNDISTGEHVGTHFDAPVHWATGRDGLDVASVPVPQLVAPAVVLDASEQAAADPDFVLEVEHVRAFTDEHGPLPEGGWLLYRTGWDARSHDAAAFLNADDTGPHTPGVSVECARWLAEETPLLGMGVETVGTDAGRAHSFDPPFPCHAFLLGAGKYGLTQLQNLARLPATGSVLVTAPLPIVGGSGSPARVLALVPVTASGEGEGAGSPPATVAQAVGAALAADGVRTVFGVLGSGNFHVANALVAGGARFVAARHEGGAATMADAWARSTGGLGVLTVHQGPGLTNALTGIAEAAKSRTPLLVLAADTASAAVRSNFRIDQVGLVEAVGAVSERLASPATAVTDALRAARRARLERRTVVLQMPLDVQAAPAPCGPVPGEVAAPAPVEPDGAAVDRLAALLAGARRPLLVAGRGAVLAGAREPLEAVAERTGALLATTAVAHGLFAGSAWSLGISGGFSSPVAAELIAEADVVVAVGASLTMWTTRHGRLLHPDAHVVKVDVDAAALGVDPRPRLGVVGDATATARALLARLGTGRTGWRTPDVGARVAAGRWRDTPHDDRSGGGVVDPRTLTVALDDMLPAERVVVTDSGASMGWPAMYLQVPDERGFLFMQSFQSVGLGLPTAVGAAVAHPDRLVVAAVGDGGFLMALAELETVVRLGLGVLVVVYDDAAYGAEVHHFGPQGAPLDLVRFPDGDLAALARGAGAEGVTVRSVDDLAPVARWLAGPRRVPLVVDAKVVPDLAAEWLEEAFRGH